MAQMEGASAAGSGSTRKPGASGDAAAAAQKSSRRRTKTGCLTCRKRRIKCGEEQPVCNNCIKSKRECEGYKQPVVFRQPTSDYSHPYAVATAFAGPFAGVQVPGYHLDLAGATGNEHVAYKRTSRQQFQQFDGQAWPHEQHQNLPGMPVGLISSTAGYDASREPPRPPQTFVFPQAQGQSQYQWSQHIGAQAVFQQQQQQQPPPPQQHHHQHPQPNTQIFSYEHHVVEAPRHSFSQDHFPPTTISHAPDDHSWSSQPHLPPQFSALYAVPEALRSSSSSFSNDFYDSDLTHSATTAEHTMQHHVTAPLVGVKQELISPVGDERRYSSLGFVQHPTFTKSILTTTDRSLPKITPPLPPDDDEDDQDPWDVELDFADSDSVPLSQSQHDLNTMLVKFATHNDRRPRTFTTFLDGPSILATYRPSLSGSPLNDEKVARIFCHFISVTGPCLSIFERQASLPPMTFSNTEIPASQKTLWTYTLPSIALHHPALLHAMLALSALHIAKLQETSEDPAIKHYTYAVRRISKLLSLPKRRHEIATLAANLLVGFYEVMFADHSRWNVHLAGAKVLVMEFDFASMTRIIRNMRSRARFNVAGRPAMSYEEWLHIVGIPESLLDDRDWELSEILVSKLTGYHIEYDRQWQPNFPSSEPSQDFSAKDIDEYKAKSDLYWWYCKQDIFQSMVSGDPLLMPYRRWIYCPPRGQIGKADAPYATMDYLCLIMARLTDFGGKDRARKQKVIKSQGGQWRPPPGLFPQAKPVPGPMAGSAPQSSPNPHLYSSQRQPGNALLSPQQVSLPRTSSLLQQPSMGPSQAVPNMGPPPSTTAGPLGGPGFYGMMPLATDSVEMHSAFYKMNASIHDNAFHQPSPDEDYAHSQSLEDETAAAIREHSEIVKAFDLFIDSLGPEYQCLPADSCPPISTPFGPALQYRTYPIACVLGFYYVGRILIHRFHPHMPPAAMVAAGVTAHLTMEYAQKVGRICAGLYYPQQYSLQTGNLNPALGAALMECTFFLLFAGIQFRDAGQRGWTISKLGDIAQKTGWPTSAAIAAACETAWQKMGMAGKGPPYTPTMDNKHGDIRLARMNKRGYYEEDYDDDVKADEDQNEGHDGPALPGYDRDGIRKNKSTRTHWALGLLSVEKDIERLNLDNK